MKLKQFINNAKRINLLTIVAKIVDEKKQQLIDSNKEQLSKGLLPDGAQITNLYTDSTRYSAKWATQRTKRSLQISFFDLRYTGSFYNSLTTMIKKGNNKLTIAIASKDNVNQKKHEQLTKMFGQITGIPETEQTKLEEHIDKQLTIELNNQLFK